MSHVNRSSRLGPNFQSRLANTNTSQQITLKKKHELSEIEKKCLEALNVRLMDLANLQSYAGACEASDSLKEEQEILFKIVKRSKYCENEKIAAANAIGILNQTIYSFSRKNLRKVRIPGAYLEGANLVGTDLQKADLTKVNLSQAVMNYAIFDGAKMEGLRLGQWPMIECVGLIDSLCITSDEKILIGNTGRFISVWNLQTRQRIYRLEGHEDWINSMTIFDRGKKLASASEDKTVRIWNLETGEQLKRFKGHKKAVTAVSVYNNGKKMVSGSDDKTIRIWDIETGKVLSQLKGHTERVLSLAVLENEKKVVSGSFGTIRIWSLEEKKELKIIEKCAAFVLVSFRDEKRIIAGGVVAGHNNIGILHSETGQLLSILKGHSQKITALALFKTEKKLASGSEDKTIRIWDLETNTELQKLEGHDDLITSLVVFDKEKKLVSASWSGNIHVWDLEIGHNGKKSGGHKNSIKALAVSNNGKEVISACKYDDIRVWNSETGQQFKKFKVCTFSVTPLAIFESGKKMVVEKSYDKIAIYDLETNKQLKKLKVLKGNKKIISALIVFKDGKRFACAGMNTTTIRIWDLETGKQQKKLKGEAGKVYALALFNKDKNLAVVDSNNIYIWDLESGGLSRLKLFTYSVNAMEVFNDDKMMILAEYQNLRIIDLEIQKEIFKIEQSFKITSLVFKNHEILCVGDAHGNICVWNLHYEQKKFSPELLWHSCSTLNCHGASIRRTEGLSQANRQLMQQYGTSKDQSDV